MLKKKKLNFKQWMEYGGKLNYSRGGGMPSPVSANTNATSLYTEPERVVDDSASSQQRTAGSVISGIGGIATAINPLIGAAIGAVGGIVSSSAQPAVSYKTRENTNPYGYKLGGKLKYLFGGEESDPNEQEPDNDVDDPIKGARKPISKKPPIPQRLEMRELLPEKKFNPVEEKPIELTPGTWIYDQMKTMKNSANDAMNKDYLKTANIPIMYKTGGKIKYAGGGDMFAGLTKAFSSVTEGADNGETEGDIPVDGKLDVIGFLNLRDKQKLMNFSNDNKKSFVGDIFGNNQNPATGPTGAPAQYSGQALTPGDGEGMKYGGKVKCATGGDLEALSEDAVQVKADDPSQTDSVETSKVNLDHNEVVTGSKVFSDSILNPNTGNSYATDEARNQKILGKFQKRQAKLGDTEYKDEGYLKKNSEALFQSQEQLAQMIGLRNQDGTPKQQAGMAFGGVFKHDANKKIDPKLDLKLSKDVPKFENKYGVNFNPDREGNLRLGSNFNVGKKLSLNGSVSNNIKDLINKTDSEGMPNISLGAKYQMDPNFAVSGGVDSNLKDPARFNVGAESTVGSNNLSANFNTDFDNSNLSLSARQKLSKSVDLSSRFSTDFRDNHNLGINTNINPSDKVSLSGGVNTDFKNVSGNAEVEYSPNSNLTLKGGLGYSSNDGFSGNVGLTQKFDTMKNEPKKFKYGGLFKKGKMGYDGGGPIKDPYTNYGQEINPSYAQNSVANQAALNYSGMFNPYESGTTNSFDAWMNRVDFLQDPSKSISDETRKNELGMNPNSTADVPFLSGTTSGLLQQQKMSNILAARKLNESVKGTDFEAFQNILKNASGDPGDPNLTGLASYNPGTTSSAVTKNTTTYQNPDPLTGLSTYDPGTTSKPYKEMYESGLNIQPASGPPNPNALNKTGEAGGAGEGAKGKREFPFGEVGTGVGLVSNIVNKLTNKPTFVNYKDLGKSEISLQDKAMQNIRQGESSAINDLNMEGRVARENVSARSLQSRNANLRNIATGVGKAKAGIRAQFASQMANAQMQSGQRRSAIEESNRQKDMNVDVINTQESDAVRTEAMKMDENVRKLMIEYQLGNNNRKTNDILATLLQTNDFEYDINAPTGGVKFKKKTKLR